MRSEPQGARTLVWALPISLATTFGITVVFSSSAYLDVSVQRVPSVQLCIGCTVLELFSSGFPHSDIYGSMDMCSSPQLFAAYHVLLRLLVPRHSPYALSSLTFLLRFLKHFSLLLIFLNCSLSVLIVLNCTILSYTSFTLLYIFFNVLFLIFCFECIYWNLSSNIMVGPNGLEPSTSRLSGVRSNHLSYKPINYHSVETRSPQKGGDPAARSRTATLLRLHPSHWFCLRRQIN